MTLKTETTFQAAEQWKELQATFRKKKREKTHLPFKKILWKKVLIPHAIKTIQAITACVPYLLFNFLIAEKEGTNLHYCSRPGRRG